MVTPVARREATRYLRQTFQMSERRACRVIGSDRTSVRYQGVRPNDGELRERLKKMQAAARNRESLRGKSEEGAGQKRHQREHVEIDAIGARQAVGAPRFGFLVHDLCACGQDCGNGVAQARRVGAIGEFEVDALEAPQSSEPPLRRGDVHHRDVLIVGDSGQGPYDSERHCASVG